MDISISKHFRLQFFGNRPLEVEADSEENAIERAILFGFDGALLVSSTQIDRKIPAMLVAIASHKAINHLN